MPGALVRERARRLREISEGLARRFREEQVGSVHRALTIDDGSIVVTGNYLKVSIPPGRVRNQWVDVKITGATPLTGLPVADRSGLPLDDELTTGGPNIAPAALAN